MNGEVLRKFDVRTYRNGIESLVDVVYRPEGTTAKAVRDELLAAGRLPVEISVYRYASGRPAYDDSARVTHPEEC